MEGYKTINGAKKIYWTSSNPNNPFEITRVVYSDHNGALHDIWPSVAELTKVYLVRIKQESSSNDAAALASYDECVEFHLDNNGEPMVTMLPYYEGYKNDPSKHNVYALKGDIKVYETVNGQRTGNYTTLTDCYFFSETRETKSGTADYVSIIGEGTTKYGPRPASYTAEHNYSYSNFATFVVSDEPGYSQTIEPQCGFYSPEAGYVQLGYVFDPNYQSRLWLKRAYVNQIIVFANTSSNNIDSGNIINSGRQMQAGDSITIWPKFYRTAHDENDSWTNSYYERYLGVREANSYNISVSYDNTYFNVVDNDNGSYTISVVGGAVDAGQKSIIFTDSVSGTVGTLGIIPLAAKAYSVWRNGASCTGASFNITTGNNTVITFMECSNYTESVANQTWVEYSGSNCSLTANNSGIVNITQNQTYPARFTVDGVAEGTRSLTPVIEGYTLPTLTVNVNAPTSVDFTLPNGTTSTLNSTYPYPTNWNFTTGQTSSYVITFSSNVYVASGDPDVGNGKIYVSSNGTDVILSVMSANQPSSGSTYNVDVYTSQGGTFLGTITITLYH